MMLFGDVSKVQKMRESACHRQSMLHRQSSKRLRQTPELGGVSRASAFCHDPHGFHGVEYLLSCMGADCFPEQLPEQPDILTQRLVRIIQHGIAGRAAS